MGTEGQALEEEHGALAGVARALGRVVGDIKSDPMAYVELLSLKMKKMWGLAPSKGEYAGKWMIVIPTAALSAFAYAGCLAGFFLHKRKEEVCLAVALILIYTIPHLVFYAQPRYRLPVMPVMFIFTGVAFGALMSRMGWRGAVFDRLATSDQQGSI